MSDPVKEIIKFVPCDSKRTVGFLVSTVVLGVTALIERMQVNGYKKIIKDKDRTIYGLERVRDGKIETQRTR